MNYEPRFNDNFSRNNLPRTKDWAYVINLNDKNSKEKHWVSLLIDINLAVYLLTIYFYTFWIEYISEEVLKKIKDKSITHNILRIQDNEYII